ncbi:PAS domain-containing protein, partial [Streptomyces sp. NPDC002143]
MDQWGQQIGRLTPPPGGNAGIAVTDHDGNIAYWSSDAEAVFGYTPAEATGKHVTALLTSDGTPRHRDGHLLNTQIHLSPLLDAEHKTGLLLTIAHRTMTGTYADSALTGWMFEQQPPALVIFDLEARVLRMNEPMQQMTGVTEHEAHGRRQTEFLFGPPFEEAEQRLLRVAETGRAEALEQFVKLPGAAKAHAWVVDIFPLKDSAGQVRAVGFAVSDFSQQYGSRERLALLSEARTHIGSSLDIVRTAQEITEVAVPRFADFVSVDILHPVYGGELPSPSLHDPHALRRTAHRSAFEYPLFAGLPNPGESHTPPQSSPVALCLADDWVVMYN